MWGGGSERPATYRNNCQFCRIKTDSHFRYPVVFSGMDKMAFHKRMRAGTLVAAGTLLIVAGCTNGNGPSSTSGTSTGNSPRTAIGFAQFPDIAVPAGAKMDVERSLVLGARDDWIGRLAMSATGSTSEAYDFFLREMPKFGWQEITTVRSEISVLTYSRQDRVATIQIRNKTLGGSAIDITVSPRGRLPASAAGSAAMPAAPAGVVETAPAR
jgi:hypothetical protein